MGAGFPTLHVTFYATPQHAYIPDRLRPQCELELGKFGNLVDPASSHMLVSKIKPCMSKYKLLYGETADGCSQSCHEHFEMLTTR